MMAMPPNRYTFSAHFSHLGRRVAHALAGAVSRLVSIPRSRADSLSRPGVGMSGGRSRQKVGGAPCRERLWRQKRIPLDRSARLGVDSAS